MSSSLVTAPPDLGEAPGPLKSTYSMRPSRVVGAASATLAVLALVGIGAKSLWFDEGYVVGLLRSPWSDFWRTIADREANQSAYYLLLKLWADGTESEAALRSVSAFFAVLTVPAIYLLGRRLSDARVGVLAAVLFASNAFVVEWAQQLRSYSLAMFLVTVSSLLLLRALETGTPRSWVLYSVVSALSVYAHFFAALVLLAHLLSMAAIRPLPRRQLLLSGLTHGVLLLPLGLFFLSTPGDQIDWVARPDIVELVATAGDVAGGPFPLVLIYLVPVLMALRAGLAASSQRVESIERWKAVMPLLWLVTPIVLVVGATYTVKPVLVPRYLSICVPALVLVASVGLTAMKPRRVASALMVAIVGLQLLGVFEWHTAGNYEDWPGAARQIAAGAQSGDVIVVLPMDANPTFDYYAARVDGMPPRVAIPQAGDPAPAKRLWEVERPSAEDARVYTPTFGDWLDANYLLERTYELDIVVVREYVRRH